MAGMWTGLKNGVAAGVLAAGVLTGILAPLAPAEAQITLRRGNGSEPDTLDPHQASGTWEHNIISDMLLGLTTEDAAAHPIPGAAESWTVSDDGLVWVFKLREGLVWSDGEPVKASDYVYALRRIMDPLTAARYAFLLFVIKNAEDINSGKVPKEDLGVRAIDQRTIEITLGQPAPFLPGLLRHYASFPVPQHVVEKYGRDWIKPGNMVSNGPYVLAEWVPNGHVKLVKNPRFYDPGSVQIDEVYFYPIEDERVALTRFRANEIDMNIATTGFPIDQLPWLKENMPGQAHIYTFLATEYLFMNMRRAPFNDIRLRRAIGLAIDNNLIVEKVRRDGGEGAYSFVPPVVDNYSAGPRVDYADWPMDKRKDEARRLLKEAGYGPGNPLTFEMQYRQSFDRRRTMVAVSALLSEVGIIARPFGNESKVHYNNVQTDNYVVAEAGWVADYNDPQTFLSLLESNAGPFNYPGYKNAEYDRLMSQAKVMLDLKERAKIMAQAEQIALDDQAVTPFIFTTTKTLVAPYIKGYVDNAENIHRTRWLRIERQTAQQ